MSEHFHKELDELRESFLEQGKRVGETIEKAIEAFLERDEELARTVLEEDHVIDEHEIKIEEECLKLMALYQPIASDLRFLISAIKINNDLERIADLSSNICERVITISAQNKLDMKDRFKSMTDKVRSMVQESLKSLIETDGELARNVRKADDEVDDLHRKTFKVLIDEIQDDPDVADVAIQNISISRYLERIADHACNIAEDVIYMMEGEIIRHTSEEPEDDEQLKK